MFCPQCGDEFRDGFQRCPDCKLDLVTELGSEPPPDDEPLPDDELLSDGEPLPDDDPLVELGVTSDRTLLAVLKSVLENGGIPYALQGEEALGVLPILASGATGAPVAHGTRILVREADLAAASELVSSVADVTDDFEDESESLADTKETASENRHEPTVATDWFEVLTVGAVVCLWSYVDTLGVWIWPPTVSQEPGSIYLIELYQAAVSIPTILVVLYIISSNDSSWRTNTGLMRPGFSDTVFALPVLFFKMALSSALYSIFGAGSFSDDNPEVTHAAEYFVSLLGAAVGAFEEELVFRGYLIIRLRTLLGSQWLAVLISALVFGSLHLHQDISGVVQTTIFGIFYGFVFSVVPRLWPLVVAHLLWNLSIIW